MDLIDYEVRFFTNLANKILKKKFTKNEIVFFKKFKNYQFKKKKIIKYFKVCKLKKIILRPLTFNKENLYFDQVKNLKKEFINYTKVSNILIEESLTIPFFKLIPYEKIKYLIPKYNHFDINISWYDNASVNKKIIKMYKQLFVEISKKKNPYICLEPVKNFNNNAAFALYNEITQILNWNRFKNINILIPAFSRLNCFFDNPLFSGEKKIMQRRNTYFLTSAAHSYKLWSKLLKTVYSKKKFLYASDHPFNNLKSVEMYNYFFKKKLNSFK